MNKNKNNQIFGQAVMTIAKGDEKLAGAIVEKIKGNDELVSQIQSSIEEGAKVEELVDVITQGLDNISAKETAFHKMGAKIKYLDTLKGKCPEGEEIAYSKGGCKVCKKKALVVNKEKCGAKMKPSKKELGGILEMINTYKQTIK